MSLRSILSPSRIAVVDRASGPDDLIDILAGLLGEGGDDAERSAIAESLRQRERMGSTAIGHGVAVPHARNAAFRDPRGAFLRLARPIDFGARDGEPVDLVFAMCAPEDTPELHLQHLAGVAERFADPEFRDRLRMARSIDALRGLLLDRPRPAASAAA